MGKSAIITFSNGETLTVYDEDEFLPICKEIQDNKIFTSEGAPFSIWMHSSAGLIPSLTELICSCEFFRVIGSQKYYKSSSIVSLESI